MSGEGDTIPRNVYDASKMRQAGNVFLTEVCPLWWCKVASNGSSYGPVLEGGMWLCFLGYR